MLSEWTEATCAPRLDAGELHVWRVWLDRPDEHAEPHSRLTADFLTLGEQARAARFRSPLDSRRWSSSRRWLRRLSGAYAGIDPAEVEFTAGPHGKPQLAAVERGGLRFNASRAAGVALFAFDLEAEVGVDVEQCRERLDSGAIARRVLGAEAALALQGAPDRERLARFTRMWARHEAAAKCRGDGLDERRWPEVSAGLWIVDLQVAEGFAAAVAAPSPPRRIVLLDPTAAF
jgi:4'-phosphopantetheinyl transferase